jgi:hypothetical protein
VKRILFLMSGFLRCRVISDCGKPYLERYYLFSVFGVRAYLHRFVASDPDRGQHDHPWPWATSFVLAGWYYEMRRRETRIVRWLNFITGDTFHRVILPSALDEVWTLFVHRAKDAKEWGFMRDLGDMGQLYTPHSFPGASTHGKWWKSSPTGNQLRKESV